MSKQYLTILPLVLVFAVSLGCGSKLPPGMPKLYPVTATVTFEDGKPVGGASVIFLLTDPVLSRTWLHAGTTDSAGKVKLMTDGEYTGIPAGKYSVTIEKYEVEGTKERAVEAEKPAAVPPDGRLQRPSEPPPMPARGTVVPRFQLVEDVYLDHAKTPLKGIEVTKGTNEIPLSAGKEQRISKPLRPGM